MSVFSVLASTSTTTTYPPQTQHFEPTLSLLFAMQALAITTPAVKPAVKDNFFTRMIERIKSPKDTQPKLRPLSLVVGVTEKEAAMRQGFWKRVQQVTRLACFLS